MQNNRFSGRRYLPHQRGSSAFGLILTLAVIGYAVFVAIQYVPQHVEWITVTEVLDEVQSLDRQHGFGGPQDVWEAIDRQLYVNNRGDLKEVFTVTPAPNNSYVVSARYQRPLNLLFTQTSISHSKSVELH